MVRDKPDGTRSIGRAFALLRVVATGGQAGLGLSQVSALSGLPRPTAHRILSALVGEGLLEQRRRSRRYALGIELQYLALSRTIQAPLVRLAEPALQEAAAELGDTLFLTMRSGLDTICVARRSGSYPIQVLALEVGDRRPLGVSSAGIAFLAALSDEEAIATVRRNELRLRSSGANSAEVLDSARRARAVGYALRSPGIVPGTRAVSVGIRDGGRGTIGAVTVAAISRRLNGGRVEAAVDVLRGCAAWCETALAQASLPLKIETRHALPGQLLDGTGRHP